jgi:hypothetical protein
MQRRHHRLIAGAAALVALVVLPPTPVSAHAMTTNDGNDTAGPLDLQSVTVTHDALNAKFRFKTFTAWPKTALRGDSYLLILIDRDENQIADRCLFIYYYGGALRGARTNCGRRNLGVQPVSKPSGTTATITTGITTLGGTHLWAAGSFFAEARPCLRGCFDSVPNRVPILHDLVPPTPSWTTVSTDPFLSTQLSNSLTVPVAFDLVDADTGVNDWRIDRLTNVYTGAATTIASGTAPASGTNLSVAEGETYVLKLVATDLHGNIGTSLNTQPLRFGVPYDDTNVIMEYAGAWTPTANASYFGGGYHSTASEGDTLTFTFTSSGSLGSPHVYFLGGPGNGTASWTNGKTFALITQTPSTPVGEVTAGWTYAAGVTETLTLTVTSGTIIVDGIAVVMDH